MSTRGSFDQVMDAALEEVSFCEGQGPDQEHVDAARRSIDAARVQINVLPSRAVTDEQIASVVAARHASEAAWQDAAKVFRHTFGDNEIRLRHSLIRTMMSSVRVELLVCEHQRLFSESGGG